MSGVYRGVAGRYTLTLGLSIDFDKAIEPNTYKTEFSPNNNYIAAIFGQFGFSYNKKTVEVYNVGGDWLNESTISPHTFPYCIAFSQDNNYLAVGERDDNLYIYDTSTWLTAKTLSQASGYVTNVDFSYDNNYVAYSDNTDGYIHNVSDWSIDATVGSGYNVGELQFSQNNEYLVASSGTVIRVLSVPDWNVDTTITTDIGNHIRLSHDNNYMGCIYGGTIYIHNIGDGWSTAKTIIASTDSQVYADAISFSKDGRLFGYGTSGVGYKGAGYYYIADIEDLWNPICTINTGDYVSTVLPYDYHYLNDADFSYNNSYLAIAHEGSWFDTLILHRIKRT